MKYLIAFAVVFAVAQGLSTEDSAKIRKKMMKNVKDCQEETGAKTEDITMLLQKKTPTKSEGRCFLFCMQRKMGLQDDAGKKNLPGVDAWIAEMKSMDADLSGKMKQVADKCIPQVDDSGNACDTAAIIFECSVKAADELGVRLNF